jgi:pSer/pThr/pTyr-binding forkhead associated (FHA) protein
VAPVPEPAHPVVPPPLLPPPLVGPQAIIEVRLPDGSGRDVTFEGSVLDVGRGTDNDIVIPDERVSRHHGRFSARHGTLVYTDLGSTNGSLVGGVRVREVALGAGDVVRLGRATLTVRPRP